MSERIKARRTTSIQESLDDAEKMSGSGNKEYNKWCVKPGVDLRYPNKDKETEFVFLPAMPIDRHGEPLREGVLPYRKSRDNFEFTEWVRLVGLYKLGGSNFLSVKVWDPTIKKEPIGLIVDAAFKNSKFHHFVGKMEDGKMHKDAYKSPVRNIDFKMMANVWDPYAKPEEGKDVYVMLLPHGAVAQKGYKNFDPAEPRAGKKGVWGLFSELDRLVRHPDFDQTGASRYDWGKIFFQGDITDPEDAAICSISLQKSPTGSDIGMYNCEVVAGVERMIVPQEILDRRKDWVDDVLPEFSFSEYLDDVAKVLLDVDSDARELLTVAWKGEGPEYDAALDRNLRGAAASAAKASPEPRQPRQREEPETATRAPRRPNREPEPEAEQDEIPFGKEEPKQESATPAAGRRRRILDDLDKEA
jgi:hypothetical protein